MLPHQKEKNSDEPFVTMDQELARHFSHTHPNRDDPDMYAHDIPAHKVPNKELEVDAEANDAEATD